MITFRIDFSSIFDRKIVEKLSKNRLKIEENNKSKKNCKKSEKHLKTDGFQMFFEVPLVPNSQKIDQKIMEIFV